MNEETNEKKKYQCNQCTKSYLSLNSLHSHTQVQHKGLKFKCGYCPKEFAYISNKRRHIKTNHVKIVYICDRCGKKFKTQDHLTIHGNIPCKILPNLTPKKPSKINCSSCGVAVYKNYLYRHERYHCKNLWKCDICGVKLHESDKAMHIQNNHFELVVLI